MPPNKPPVAVLEIVREGDVTTPTIIDCSSSFDDKHIKKVYINWGDDNGETEVSGIGRFTHQYEFGQYGISLRIVDNQGREDIDNKIVNIKYRILRIAPISDIILESPNGDPIKVNEPIVITSGGQEPVTISYDPLQDFNSLWPIGDYSFKIIAHSTDGQIAEQMIIIKINPGVPIPPPPTLAILTDSPLPNELVNDPVDFTFTGSGGTVPYNWSVISGSLPTGLSLASNGHYSGTPTVEETATFTIRLTDSLLAVVDKTFQQTITTIGFPLQITTSSLAGGDVGEFYSQTLQGSGGTPPYVWSLFSGTLPNGLSLTSGGVIQGTPTTQGTFTFQVKLQDNVGTQVFRTYLIGVGSNAYFDMMTAKPEMIVSQSLRDQAQLNSLVTNNNSFIFRYLYPSNDDYPTPQDGAKLLKPPRNTFTQYPVLAPFGDVGDENIPPNQTLRIDNFGVGSGNIFITWDFWYGQEFQTNRGTLDAFKMYFLFGGPVVGSSQEDYQILHELLTGGGLNPALGELWRHRDDSEGVDLPRIEGVTTVDPFTPTGLGANTSGTFKTYHSRWTRYWLEIKLDQLASAFTDWNNANGVTVTGGPWDMVSLWIADEQRDRTRVLYRVPFKRPINGGTGLRVPMITQFRISFDTSTNNTQPGTGLTGPYIGYIRNLVIEHNLAIDEGNPILWPKPI